MSDRREQLGTDDPAAQNRDTMIAEILAQFETLGLINA